MSARRAGALPWGAVVAAGLITTTAARPHPAAAQRFPATASIGPLPADSIRKSFAIPVAPATALIEGASGRLLRPSSVRELAVEISRSTDGAFRLPTALAVEFAPLLLARGHRLTLAAYRAHAVWYRTRVSLATSTGSRAAPRSELALGVRTSVLDATDPRTDERLLAQLQRILARESANDDSLDARIAAAGIALIAADQHRLTLAERHVVDSLRRLHDAAADSLDRTFAARVRSWREDSVWNRPMIDLAVAVRWAAHDTAGRGLRVDDLAAWATFATGTGRSLQWLLGLRPALVRDTVTGRYQPAGTAATRLYVGRNANKAFAEVQATARRGRSPTWLGQAGGELAIAPAIWATLVAGWEHGGRVSGGGGRLISRVGLAVGMPNARR